MLVDLERVKESLRLSEGDFSDDLLVTYIMAASNAVMNYLKGHAEEVIIDDSPPMVPDEVQMATIILVGHFIREPDGDSQKAYEMGMLPAPVTALLYPLRDPALA